MSKRSSGLLSGKSRNLTRHNKPSSLSVNDIIKSFKVGDKVAVVPKSTYRNIPHPRYKGKIGVVLAQRGSAYEIEIKSMSAKRKLVVPVVHLDKV